SKRGCINKAPPFIKVSSDTQIPKLKVICSTKRERVRLEKRRRLSIACSFPIKARWLSTTPLGCPVDPEVKITKAAPARISRSGGRDSPIWRTGNSADASASNRALVRTRVSSKAAVGVDL